MKLKKLLAYILIGSFIIIVTGIFDDIKPIPAKIKFLFQIVAAGIVAIYGDILLRDLSAFGFYINFGNFSLCILTHLQRYDIIG